MGDFTEKGCAGFGLKVLRKEDEEKDAFPVALRRANGLGLMTSLEFIVNEPVQHGKDVALLKRLAQDGRTECNTHFTNVML